LLDCPHEHLVRLRIQQQLVFPPQFEDGPARLRTFMNQPDIFGVASFVAKCPSSLTQATVAKCPSSLTQATFFEVPSPVPLIFLAFSFGLVTGFFPSFRSDAHQRHI